MVPINYTANLIIDTLALTLSEYYPGVNVYTEQVGQGFARPAFFIMKSGQRDHKELGQRFLRLHEISISYFPDPEAAACENDAYEELWNVGDELTFCLRLVEREGNCCHGRDMQMAIEDGALKFTVCYPEQLEISETTTKMNNLQVNGVID